MTNSRLKAASSSWLLEFFLSFAPGLLALEEMLRMEGFLTDSLLRRDRAAALGLMSKEEERRSMPPPPPPPPACAARLPAAMASPSEAMDTCGVHWKPAKKTLIVLAQISVADAAFPNFFFRPLFLKLCVRLTDSLSSRTTDRRLSFNPALAWGRTLHR